MECINFLISLGEIPNLFNPDDAKALLSNLEEEMTKANEQMKADQELIDTSKQSLYAIVAERVIRNLHIFIAVTPGSAALDRIVTSFPSLLGSLTIDWFTPWEVDTLRSIAKYQLKAEPTCDKIVDVLVQVHQDT